MEPLQNYLVNSCADYLAVAAELRRTQIVNEGDSFAVLIGCSGHSPIQPSVFDSLVHTLAVRVLVPHRVRVLWGGGDPCFGSKHGGNIADVARSLLEMKAIAHVGAVQRNDWLERTPTFERIRVGYPASMAVVGGKKTFGGFERAPPEGVQALLDQLKTTKFVVTPPTHSSAAKTSVAGAGAGSAAATDVGAGAGAGPGLIEAKAAAASGSATRWAVNTAFLPTTGAFPVAATSGYMSLLPALCGAGALVVAVVLRAGFITLRELEYLNALLQRLHGAQARAKAAKRPAQSPALAVPVFVYGLSWHSMAADLSEAERTSKCKVQEAHALLKSMVKAFPDNVFELKVDPSCKFNPDIARADKAQKDQKAQPEAKATLSVPTAADGVAAKAVPQHASAGAGAAVEKKAAATTSQGRAVSLQTIASSTSTGPGAGASAESGARGEGAPAGRSARRRRNTRATKHAAQPVE